MVQLLCPNSHFLIFLQIQYFLNEDAMCEQKTPVFVRETYFIGRKIET